MILVRELLKNLELSDETEERIVYLVNYHHLQKISGLDYQTLIEADRPLNADETITSGKIVRKYRAGLQNPN